MQVTVGHMCCLTFQRVRLVEACKMKSALVIFIFLEDFNYLFERERGCKRKQGERSEGEGKVAQAQT